MDLLTYLLTAGGLMLVPLVHFELIELNCRRKDQSKELGMKKQCSESLSKCGGGTIALKLNQIIGNINNVSFS